MAPRVRLVVLNYDGGDDLLRCVEALERVHWPTEDLELVVVDNGSTDGSIEAVAREHPRVHVVHAGANLGFAGNNLAMEQLGDVDAIGLVNNDAFVEPGFLAPLVDALTADPRLGAACPKILLADAYVAVRTEVAVGARIDRPLDAVPHQGWLRPDSVSDPRLVAVEPQGSVFVPQQRAEEAPVVVTTPPARSVTASATPLALLNNAGNHLVAGWYAADRGLHEPDDGRYDEPAPVFAWSGGAVLLRKEFVQDVGGFDPRLFLYYEDLDLSWRGRARGWRYLYVPTSVVRHRLAGSTVVGSPLFRYLTERNRLVVLTVHAELAVVAAVVGRFVLSTASFVLRDVVRPLSAGRRPDTRLVRLRLRALVGYLRLLPHAVGRRREVDRTAVVPRRARVPMGMRPGRSDTLGPT